MFTYIYALCDPETDEVRYIGKSDNPSSRYSQHLLDKGSTWKANWIRSLKARKLRPVLRILEEVTEDYWEVMERRWIEHYRRVGSRLTNLTDGGTVGGCFEPSSCIKISEKKRTRCHQGVDHYCTIEWDSSYQRWAAYLKLDDEIIKLGLFHSKSDAMESYDHLAENVYGLPTFIDLRTENAYRLRGHEDPFLTQTGSPRKNKQKVLDE